jgi:hypothetical protein
MPTIDLTRLSLALALFAVRARAAAGAGSGGQPPVLSPKNNRPPLLGCVRTTWPEG